MTACGTRLCDGRAYGEVPQLLLLTDAAVAVQSMEDGQQGSGVLPLPETAASGELQCFEQLSPETGAPTATQAPALSPRAPPTKSEEVSSK